MALKTGDNFDYQGQKPNFGRDSFKTLAEMKAYPETSIDDGHISYVAETKRHYKFVSSSSPDPTTGKWRTIEDQEITETSTNPVESKAIYAKFDEYAQALAAVEAKADEALFRTASDYCVAGWTVGDAKPEASEIYGNPEFCDEWEFWLADTKDNAGEYTNAKKLRRNNLLRYDDGSWAPTVGITEEQRAACDVELYLDTSGSKESLYCAAGDFDAAQFYETYGVTQKLYNVSGEEVRVLRPWETTSTDYTIGVGRDRTVYLLDNVIGKSGKRWKGIFSKPTVWDGCDTTPWELKPTAFSPCPITTVGGKTRNFFYNYVGDHAYCRSMSSPYGSAVCSHWTDKNAYFPRTRDVNQVNLMNWARANNSDATSPVPFAEGGYHTLNTYVTSYEVMYQTKYLHKSTMFSSGTSSNDSCSSETTWKANGGVRYRLPGAETWTYQSWGSTPGNIYWKNDGTEKTYWSWGLNSITPKIQCMGPQMALSYAVELGIQPGVEFDFYGETYWYETVNGTVTPLDGKPNARVYTKDSLTIHVFDSSGNPMDVEVEYILRNGLINGANLSGDIWWYVGGGYEQVATCKNVTSGSREDRMETYTEPDQSKWLRETTISKANLGVFDFESSYIKTGDAEPVYDGWALTRFPYSGMKSSTGGGIGSGECYHNWLNNYRSSTLNTRTRSRALFRGSASYSFCSPRNLLAHGAASNSDSSFGGSAQFRLQERRV